MILVLPQGPYGAAKLEKLQLLITLSSSLEEWAALAKFLSTSLLGSTHGPYLIFDGEMHIIP